MPILVVTILAALSLPAVAPPVLPADSTRAEADSAVDRSPRLLLLPIVFSSPDTRLGLGVLPQIIFRSAGSGNPSSLRLDSYYTLNKQYHILLRPRIWLDGNSKNLTGKFSFKKWPTSFYGIGNRTLAEGKEKFTETLYEASVEGVTRIGSGYYAGVSYTGRYAEIDPDSSAGLLVSGTGLTGNGTSFVSAVGAVFKLDTRNHQFYPTRGSYHTVELLWSDHWLGSDFGFTRISADFRRYLPINEKQVLALRGMVTVSGGNVPFRMLSSVGSTIRGYSSVRYIDRHMAGFQVEYRFVPVAWRLGLTLFAGAGEVFGRPSDIRIDNLKYNAGIGIRYQFSRSEKINIRYDYGIGRDSSGDYLDLEEAY